MASAPEMSGADTGERTDGQVGPAHRQRQSRAGGRPGKRQRGGGAVHSGPPETS